MNKVVLVHVLHSFDHLVKEGSDELLIITSLFCNAILCEFKKITTGCVFHLDHRGIKVGLIGVKNAYVIHTVVDFDEVGVVEFDGLAFAGI